MIKPTAKQQAAGAAAGSGGRACRHALMGKSQPVSV